MATVVALVAVAVETGGAEGEEGGWAVRTGGGPEAEVDKEGGSAALAASAGKGKATPPWPESSWRD
jgi:hypothetical protein